MISNLECILSQRLQGALLRSKSRLLHNLVHFPSLCEFPFALALPSEKFLIYRLPQCFNGSVAPQLMDVCINGSYELLLGWIVRVIRTEQRLHLPGHIVRVVRGLTDQ